MFRAFVLASAVLAAVPAAASAQSDDPWRRVVTGTRHRRGPRFDRRARRRLARGRRQYATPRRSACARSRSGSRRRAATHGCARCGSRQQAGGLRGAVE